MRRIWIALALAGSLPASAFCAPRTLRVLTTGYCIGKCKRCGTQGITALGSRSLKGIAVGRRRRAIALRSVVNVPGYGRAPVDDVGGGVGGNQLDLRFRSHKRAALWGRRWKTVTVENRRKKYRKRG